PEGRAPERLIDGTLGAGGHSAALLAAGAGEVLGLALDPQALAAAAETLAPYGPRAYIVHGSYAQMTQQAATLGWPSADAILLDLGVSSMQFDTPERGFAFRLEAPLDMRFDPGGQRPTAAELVNTLDADELADIFWRYGEERESRRLARAVVKGRPYTTTTELASAIEQAMPRRWDDRLHPATRVFQALRIAVNDELGVIEAALPRAIDLLSPGGRLAVISFHSLEDRIVKDAFRLAATDCICPPRLPVCVCGHEASVTLLSRKPITAHDEEIALNPRSRSAKLRVVEKKEVEG
ncbi:MAG TPA: 16S rRNA (cytosine(1402)-N(4))-methyltransferase RsmH, partial [Candidatus Limnocylindrales bacterium]|nr:16S rRNA (cytosine(1402)-N(4))-methyltransferase RsmH [Candidatus Limnocylindrales bacterium]